MSTTTTTTRQRTLTRLTGFFKKRSAKGELYYQGAIQAPSAIDPMPEDIRAALETLAKHRVLCFKPRKADAKFDFELQLDYSPPQTQAVSAPADNNTVAGQAIAF